LIPVITRALKESEALVARRQVKKALRDAEEKMRFAIERIAAVVWTTDRQLCVTSIQGAGLVPGVREAGMIGKSPLKPDVQESDITPLPASAAKCSLTRAYA
jgi:hypothetical protein